MPTASYALFVALGFEYSVASLGVPAAVEDVAAHVARLKPKE